MSKKVEKNNSFLGVCPICRKDLNKDKSSIINKNKTATLFCVECGECASSVMLAIFPTSEKMTTTMGILTDIQHEDEKLIKNGYFLTVDNMLEFYEDINK